MADQDPYAATAIKPGKKTAKAAAPAGDPYAATAVQTSAPPAAVTVPPTTPPEGFLASAAAPFVDSAKALIPHSWKELERRVTPGLAQYDAIKNLFVKPAIEQGKQAVDEFKQANAQTPWYSMHPSPDAVNHRELALGHGLAAIVPGVGPWAAQIGQKEGEQFGAGNYPGAAGTAFGNALLALIPEIAGKVPKISESVARAVTDTGTGPVKRLVKDTQKTNETIDAVNQDRVQKQQKDQAAADTDYRGDLLKLRQKYEQDVRDSNQKFSGNKAAAEKANADALRAYNQKVGQVIQQRRAVASANQARTQAAAQTQVYGSQLIYRLNQLDRALRDRAGTMFDAVREKVGTVTRPGTDLGTAARAALSKISGSSEVPKPFKDILGKYPETDPEFIEYQGAQIPKTNRLYDVLKQQGMGTGAPPVTFGDLQGYYSETGAELSKGTLPGDVYQATKELHNAIGDMMQEMASSAGAGKEFWDSRVFYRNYMDAFHEPTGPSGSGSPVAQVLLAKDPATAVAKFSGAAGDRGVAILRKYDPSLADLARKAGAIKSETAGATAGAPRTAKSITSVPEPKTTPVPTGASLPLPPVLPEPKTVPVELKPRQTISSPDLAAARRAAAESRADWVNHRGMIVATWPIFQAMRALWGGHIPSIPMMGIETVGSLAVVRSVSQLLQRAPMMEFLTKARPEDLASIPPDLRGDLPGLVSLAQRQGIKVAPALVAAATAGAARQSSPQVQQPAMQGATQ